MLVASAMAAVAFPERPWAASTRTAPLGARFHKHHGLLSSLLPYVLIANQPVINADIARLAHYMNYPT